MSVEQNEAAVRRAADAWNAGDLDGYLDLYDDEIRLHGYAPEPMDKIEVRAFYASTFAAFADLRLDFHEVFGSGEAVTIRFSMSGRHTGEFMGVAATGRPIHLDGITILHFRDGRCVERWSQADMLGLLVQLGAIPAPGT